MNRQRIERGSSNDPVWAPKRRNAQLNSAGASKFSDPAGSTVSKAGAKLDWEWKKPRRYKPAKDFVCLFRQVQMKLKVERLFNPKIAGYEKSPRAAANLRSAGFSNQPGSGGGARRSVRLCLPADGRETSGAAASPPLSPSPGLGGPNLTTPGGPSSHRFPAANGKVFAPTHGVRRGVVSSAAVLVTPAKSAKLLPCSPTRDSERKKKKNSTHPAQRLEQ